METQSQNVQFSEDWAYLPLKNGISGGIGENGDRNIDISFMTEDV